MSYKPDYSSDAFEVKTDGEILVKDQYLTDDVDEFKIPGMDLVAEYVKWYYDNS